MDSLTQAALGAAVAYAGWARQLGRWAPLWGAGVATLPDLDVAAFPVMDAVERLYWHRGPSHGLLFVVLASVATAALVRRVHRRAELSWPRALLISALIYVTHVLIDLFTVYGTQILAPFSRHGFGTNNLFIIDPLFTLPLVVAVLWSLGSGRAARTGRVAVIGLIVSSGYVAWSFAAQARAADVFRAALEEQGASVRASQTSATALNTVLWRHLAAVEGGFLVGYWSLLDPDEQVLFQFVPQQADQVEALRGTRAFAAVDWFSQGYWVAERDEHGVRLADLRFGETRPEPRAAPEQWSYVFSWYVGAESATSSGLEPVPEGFDVRRGAWSLLWRRLRGDPLAW